MAKGPNTTKAANSTNATKPANAAPPADDKGGVIISASAPLRNVDTTRALIERVKATPEAMMAKSGNLDVERLLALAYICVRRNPDLLKCTQQSFGGALVKCIQYGFYPDERGLCYLIPRKTGPKVNGKKMEECHFQMGYQGLCELARRSNQIEKIEGRVVYEHDHFEYEYGSKPKCEHRPIRGQSRGSLLASYAIAWLRNSREPTFVVLEREDVLAIKKMAYITESSPWVTHEGKMWVKSAVIQVTKLLPMSTELAEAVALDELSSAGLTQNLEFQGLPATKHPEGPGVGGSDEGGLGVEDMIGGAGDDELGDEDDFNDPQEEPSNG
jgi:recombination protein RecT